MVLFVHNTGLGNIGTLKKSFIPSEQCMLVGEKTKYSFTSGSYLTLLLYYIPTHVNALTFQSFYIISNNKL